MNSSAYFVLLSQYNQWMNSNLNQAAQGLSDDQLMQDRGAFFGSILGTLNHIMVADLFWLRRFAAHPAAVGALQGLEAMPMPTALNQILYSERESWWRTRQTLDSVLLDWTQELGDEHLAHPLHYSSSKGQAYCKPFGPLLLHMFNHQTHHRGQVSTLFSQMGIDIGATDLPLIIPNVTELSP